jgi:hypothetical protein
VLKARQKETGAIVAIKKFKVRCRVRPCPAQSTAVLTTRCVLHAAGIR